MKNSMILWSVSGAAAVAFAVACSSSSSPAPSNPTDAGPEDTGAGSSSGGGSGSSSGAASDASSVACTNAAGCATGQICCSVSGMSTMCLPNTAACPNNSLAGQPVQLCATGAECFVAGSSCGKLALAPQLPITVCNPPTGDGGTDSGSDAAPTTDAATDAATTTDAGDGG
jgi:hypothetical protein